MINRLIWAMDAGRLSLSLCEDTVEEEEENLITGNINYIRNMIKTV
jgi:hypothetical protein